MHMHHPGVTGRQQPVDGVSRSGVNGELSGQSRADPVHGYGHEATSGPGPAGVAVATSAAWPARCCAAARAATWISIPPVRGAKQSEM